MCEPSIGPSALKGRTFVNKGALEHQRQRCFLHLFPYYAEIICRCAGEEIAIVITISRFA